MAYAELDAVPEYTLGLWQGGQLVNRTDPVKWGGDAPPPEIGAKIVIRMNGCGEAVVTGYFVEDGWLGVRCILSDPPDWHRRQNKGDPRGCVFGTEFRPA